jgi:hypothetical protein
MHETDASAIVESPSRHTAKRVSHAPPNSRKSTTDGCRTVSCPDTRVRGGVASACRKWMHHVRPDPGAHPTPLRRSLACGTSSAETAVNPRWSDLPFALCRVDVAAEAWMVTGSRKRHCHAGRGVASTAPGHSSRSDRANLRAEVLRAAGCDVECSAPRRQETPAELEVTASFGAWPASRAEAAPVRFAAAACVRPGRADRK